jgi:hypothetical protein
MKNKRIQIDLNERKFSELEALQAATGSETYKDLFNTAMTLLKWAVAEVQAGNVITSLNTQDGTYKELAMPAFEEAKSRTPSPVV